MAGLVDAAIDGAAHVLQERAVDARVDLADGEIPVDHDAGLHPTPPETKGEPSAAG